MIVGFVGLAAAFLILAISQQLNLHEIANPYINMDMNRIPFLLANGSNFHLFGIDKGDDQRIGSVGADVDLYLIAVTTNVSIPLLSEVLDLNKNGVLLNDIKVTMT